MLPMKNQTNDLIPASQISTTSTAELKELLAKAVTITAEYLTYIAAVWQELESRGEDMSNMRHGLMTYIPLIATRQLDARAVVNYAGQKTLLSFIASLPMSRQKALIDAGSVDIVELSEDSQQVIKSVPLDKLTSAQVYQAFSDGEVKSPDQQYHLLIARSQVKSRPKRGYRITRNIKIDGENLVVSGKHGIPIEELIDLLKENGLV